MSVSLDGLPHGFHSMMAHELERHPERNLYDHVYEVAEKYGLANAERHRLLRWADARLGKAGGMC